MHSIKCKGHLNDPFTLPKLALTPGKRIIIMIINMSLLMTAEIYKCTAADSWYQLRSSLYSVATLPEYV